MRSGLGLMLARSPRLYAWLLRRRRTVNLELLCFLALVRRGDVVLEAGANQGYYTALFSRLVGRRGQVHAFEPVRATYLGLAAALARRHNVVLDPRALSDAAGEVTIHVPLADPAQASLARHSAGSWKGEPEVVAQTCEAVTIDGYIGARGARGAGGGAAIDFVKCDAEGAEMRILQGAAETLRRHQPLLHLEVNPDWSRDMGWEPADLPRYLAPFGYRDFVLVEDLRVRRLADPLAELAAFSGSANLVCGVPELHGGRMAGMRAALGRRYEGAAREVGGGAGNGGDGGREAG
jgi:FkbM family methyltransferase